MNKKMQKESKICIVMGTRPEIIKLAPIIRELKQQNLEFEVIYTNQHYDYKLSTIFFKELKLDQPNYNLKIGKGSQGHQTGESIIRIEKILMKNPPKLVLVQGDTNSTLAGAIAALKLHIKIGHIESGLRSYDYRMPEEHNRRMIDHVSNLLFAPTEKSLEILKRENVWGKIFKTGNTIIDACIQHFDYAERQSNIINKIPFESFVLVTSHRAENVDDPEILNNLVDTFLDIPLNLVFPVHPRTLIRLKEFNLYNKLHRSKNILLIPPVGYFDLLMLMYKCDFIITDSGGIQEEATAPNIRKFTFVIRESSDRPESCEIGFSELVGTKKNKITNAITKFIEHPKKLPDKSPFGDGKASKKIISIIQGELSN